MRPLFGLQLFLTGVVAIILTLAGMWWLEPENTRHKRVVIGALALSIALLVSGALVAIWTIPT